MDWQARHGPLATPLEPLQINPFWEISGSRLSGCVYIHISQQHKAIATDQRIVVDQFLSGRSLTCQQAGIPHTGGGRN